MQIDPRSHDVVRTDPRRQRTGGDRLRVRDRSGSPTPSTEPSRGSTRTPASSPEPSTSAARRSASPRRRSSCGSPTSRRGGSTPSPRRTATVVRRVDVGTPPVAIAATPTKLWVSAQSAPGRHRGGTLVLDAPLGSVDSIDPAIAYFGGRLERANDDEPRPRRLPPHGRQRRRADRPRPRIVGADADGRRHDVPVPVAARIRYSNGAVVSPADIRFALERDFKVHSPGVQNYAGIVGRPPCVAKPATCDLSRGVVVDPLRPSRSISPLPNRSSSTSWRCRSPTRCRRRGHRSEPVRSRFRPRLVHVHAHYRPHGAVLTGIRTFASGQSRAAAGLPESDRVERGPVAQRGHDGDRAGQGRRDGGFRAAAEAPPGGGDGMQAKCMSIPTRSCSTSS